MQPFTKRTLEIEYPCRWVYKIIGARENAMREAIAGIIQDRSYKVTLSRSSATGKFCCLDVDMLAESEGHRRNIYESLKHHPAIMLVL